MKKRSNGRRMGGNRCKWSTGRVGIHHRLFRLFNKPTLLARRRSAMSSCG